MPLASKHHPEVQRTYRIEISIALGIALPVLFAGLVCAALLLERSALAMRYAQSERLTAALHTALDAPARWHSEAAFRAAIKELPWDHAYLQDPQGAHIWQQNRQDVSHWPAPVPITLELDPATRLVVMPTALRSSQRTDLRQQALVDGLLCLGIAAALSVLAYLLASRRLQQILRWTEQLEAGQLAAAAPLHHGLTGAIAAAIQVLAQRLRFSRDALQQHSDHGQRRSESQVKELKSQLQTLSEESSRAQRLLSSRAEYLSSMNHELRTPLTAIMGFSDLLEKGELSSQQAEYVHTIRKSAKGLVSMINDLLDMERIEAGRLDIHRVGFDISDTVEDTISLLTPMAYEKNLELISIVDHDVPPRLLGDPARVQQILTNLVSNAIKFTQQGQVLVRVSSQASGDNSVQVYLQVEDSGPGLSKTQQKELFTAFQRFEDAEGPIAGGSGLGLTIVKKLTALLGGSVEVTSELGAGAKFGVSLPFTAQKLPFQRASWEALRGTRCWTLESHDSVWLAQQHLLEFWGVQSRRFTSAGELWRTVRSAKADKLPHYILLGLRADEASEQYVADTLALSRSRPVPALCLVNSVDGGLQRRLKEAGARNVMPKCSSRTSLYRACCDLLNSELPQAHSGLALQSQKVLVAENNPAGRHYLKALLDSLGAEVLLAEDGVAALRAWEAHEPEFALLDMHMPNMDGRECTRIIRERDPAGRTIIVGMSAFLSAEEERNWLDSGLNTLLTKPFDEDQLVRCLHPWLNRAQPARITAKSKPAKQLVRDPELAKMMVEELPKQLQELDEAFIEGELGAARAAAHQLHGTAAFFHLEPLKAHVFLMEKRLKDIEDIARHPRLRDDMASVSHAVTEILRQINKQIAADQAGLS